MLTNAKFVKLFSNHICYDLFENLANMFILNDAFDSVINMTCYRIIHTLIVLFTIR